MRRITVMFETHNIGQTPSSLECYLVYYENLFDRDISIIIDIDEVINQLVKKKYKMNFVG